MDVEINQDLLERFFNKQCSPEEAHTVYRWLQNPENEAAVSASMRHRWHQLLENPLEKDYQGYTGNSPKAKRLSYILKKKSSLRLSRMAAVISLIFLAGAIGWWWLGYPLPSSDKKVVVAPLLLRETLQGQKVTFKLEDGTMVTLNTESKLYYPPSFGSQERRVRLEGEGFFEVKKDASRPFRVVSDGIVTTALGTSFNVFSPDTTQHVVVSLVTGSVVVNKTHQQQHSMQQILVPGESAIYDKSRQTIRKDTSGIEDLTAWKEGVLIFKNARIEQIKAKLESWYGVKINFLNRPKESWTFTGKFKKEPLENVLKGISFSKNIEYSVHGKNVAITFQ